MTASLRFVLISTISLVLNPLATIVRADPSQAPGMLGQLQTTGVVFQDGSQHPLPATVFVTPDGRAVESDEAFERLEKVAGPQGVARFTKDSIVAPIDIRIESINNAAGERIGHRLDVTFVVHAPIAKMRDSDAVKELVGGRSASTTTIKEGKEEDPAKDSRSEPLTDEQLAVAGLSLDDEHQDVRRIRFPLLEQVIIEGVAIAERFSGDDEPLDAPVVYTWQIDPRFSAKADDAGVDLQAEESLVNRWRAIERGSRGQVVLGSQQPYGGIGGYMALSPLPGQPNATIVQASLILHEPVAWFAGRNQLRSKLPLVVQDRVRDLRRELTK